MLIEKQKQKKIEHLVSFCHRIKFTSFEILHLKYKRLSCLFSKSPHPHGQDVGIKLFGRLSLKCLLLKKQQFIKMKSKSVYGNAVETICRPRATFIIKETGVLTKRSELSCSGPLMNSHGRMTIRFRLDFLLCNRLSMLSSVQII